MAVRLLLSLVVIVAVMAACAEARGCDCDYHSGGCTISKRAPDNHACKCVYKGFWTCTGWIVGCRDRNNHYCKHPDLSIQSCWQGGGDCKGYLDGSSVFGDVPSHGDRPLEMTPAELQQRSEEASRVWLRRHQMIQEMLLHKALHEEFPEHNN